MTNHKEWLRYLSSSLNNLLSQPPVAFAGMKPKQIPDQPGIYLITAAEELGDVPFYIGRTKKLRQRLYGNHLMGPLNNARLKKYLIDNHVVADKEGAKQFIKNNCHARWIIEKNYRKRGAIEGYCTGILFPRYGIDKEH